MYSTKKRRGLNYFTNKLYIYTFHSINRFEILEKKLNKIRFFSIFDIIVVVIETDLLDICIIYQTV